MIESLQNEQVKYVVSLRRPRPRKEARVFIAEGWRFVQEALDRNAALERVFVCLERETPQWGPMAAILSERGIPVEEVSDRVLRKMCATKEPQGVLALVRQETYIWQDLKIEPDSILLIVDGIQDPGNLGSILRTALAFGVKGVCLTPGTVDIYNQKVLRSTMGAIFSLVLLPDRLPEDILAFCREQGVSVLTGDVRGNSILQTKLTDGPLALVVSNEGWGPAPAFCGSDVQSVTIPMTAEVESLNVSAAASILLYELARKQDRFKS